jgi:hypothetical protein
LIERTPSFPLIKLLDKTALTPQYLYFTSQVFLGYSLLFSKKVSFSIRAPIKHLDPIFILHEIMIFSLLKRRENGKIRHLKSNISSTESQTGACTSSTSSYTDDDGIDHDSALNIDHKEYDDKYSRQYDRSRIEQEMYDFYHYTHDPVIKVIDTLKVNTSFGVNGRNKNKNRPNGAHGYGGGNGYNNRATSNGYDYSYHNSHFGSDLEQIVDVEYEFDPGTDHDDYGSLIKDDFSLLQQEAPIQVDMDIDMNISTDISMSMKEESENESLLHDEKINSLTDGNTDDDSISVIKVIPSQVSKVEVESTIRVYDEIEKQCDGNEELSILIKEISSSPVNTNTNTKEINEKLLFKKEDEMAGMLLCPKEIEFFNNDQKTVNTTRINRAEVADIFFEDRSQISYDEESEKGITPSIAFFLGASWQDLRKEGFSIAGNESEFGGPIHNSSFQSNLHQCNNEEGNTNTVISNSNSKTYIWEEDDTKTSKGMSLASSKYTNVTPKVLELREKKRLLEHQFETKFNVLPSMIDVAINTSHKFRRSSYKRKHF